MLNKEILRIKLKTIIRSVKLIIAHYSTSIRIKSLHLMVVIKTQSSDETEKISDINIEEYI